MAMTRTRRSSGQTLSLLKGLLDQPRKWRHGYDLSIQTSLPSGTLYPILVRLEDRGFLESKWEPSPEAGRPPRHLYRLTSKGTAHARGELADDEARTLDAPEGSRA
jgi:DNA-binding PadR family transcriptional regulator